ncbi:MULTISPECIES: FecR family protein [unclassified Chitinophaga]|uniref:FecR family protein n=1 Tax=unclassified Chitinophaga TaxID=2619133 RepID=UPI00300FD598
MELNKFSETDLLQKYLDGTITEAEGTALFELLKKKDIEDNAALEALLQQVYDQSFAEPPALSGDASQRILHRLLAAVEDNNKEVPVRRIPSWWRYAAAAVLIAAVATMAVWFISNYKKSVPSLAGNVSPSGEIVSGSSRAVLKLGDGEEILLDSTQGNIVRNGNFKVNNDSGKLDYEGKAGKMEYHTLTTPRGGQYRLLLPDGTAVWLNAESSITYPTVFTDNYRKVKVMGEVYFEVAKNKDQPFMVDVNSKATVAVLGTSFNVNAYTDEQNIRTTLLEGSIMMIHDQQTAMLRPGQQAQINNELKMNIINNADVEMVVAWKNGLFRFDHAHLDEVLRQMSRWYDVGVVYENGVPDIIFSGEIKRDLNLSQALVVLEKMGVHYRIEGKKIIVMP